MMILLYCLISLLWFATGFKLGSSRQRLKDQKEIDQHTKYIKNTMYNLIDFGMKKGYPFEQVQELEKSDIQLGQRDQLLLSLRVALESENYEEASILRDKIINYERDNNQ